MVGDAGVPLAPLPGNPRENLESPTGQAILTTRNLAALPGRLARLLAPGLPEAAPAAARDLGAVLAAEDGGRAAVAVLGADRGDVTCSARP